MKHRRDTSKLRRRKPRLEPRRLLIIVCEGAQTEPNYFDYYRQNLRLSNVSVRVFGEECGSDPLSVVEFALHLMDEDQSIDECHCVIDRDSHDSTRLKRAQSQIKNRAGDDPDRQYSLYVSDPCIEYWFLLHFKFTRAPFQSTAQKSRGDHAKDELKTEWPGYRKNSSGTGKKLDQKFETAESHAERALDDAKKTGNRNPTTEVHRLVRHLKNLAS